MTPNNQEEKIEEPIVGDCNKPRCPIGHLCRDCKKIRDKIPKAGKIYSIQIIIKHDDQYCRDAFIQRKSHIKKLIKENPVLYRLTNGDLA